MIGHIRMRLPMNCIRNFFPISLKLSMSLRVLNQLLMGSPLRSRRRLDKWSPQHSRKLLCGSWKFQDDQLGLVVHHTSLLGRHWTLAEVVLPWLVVVKIFLLEKLLNGRWPTNSTIFLCLSARLCNSLYTIFLYFSPLLSSSLVLCLPTPMCSFYLEPETFSLKASFFGSF